MTDPKPSGAPIVPITICPEGLESSESGATWCTRHQKRMVTRDVLYQNESDPTTHQKNGNPQTF